MKFSMVVVIVPEEHEDKAIDKVKEAGATGVTVVKGNGIGLKEKKTFFGLSYERNESVLLCVTERSVGFKVLKYIRKELDFSQQGSGLAFSIPLDHLVGLDHEQLMTFENEREE